MAALGTRRGVACAGWFEGLFGADQLTNGGQTADDVECGRRRRVMGWRVLGGSRVGRARRRGGAVDGPADLSRACCGFRRGAAGQSEDETGGDDACT